MRHLLPLLLLVSCVDTTSPLDCDGVLRCGGDCFADDLGCIDACLARATVNVALARPVATCAAAASCFGSGDTGCLRTECATPLAACVATGGTGGGSGTAGGNTAGGTGTAGFGNAGGTGTSGFGSAGGYTAGGNTAGGGAGTAGGGAGAAGGTGGTGGSGDGFPNRWVGTVTDENSNFGGLVLRSVGQAVFVRDDSADPRGTTHAFYKLLSITYTATVSGTSAGGCTHAASEVVTFMNPPPFENLVAIRKMASGGEYEYDITTTLSQARPNAETITCPPPAGVVTANFNAENNVAAGVPAPKTSSLTRLQATVPAFMQPTRTWSWDLQAMP
ncbi:MAG: hypothetical protein JNK82_42075 [Myxococcaceae bacterium]|nr:hypothetical protein [Myxococcaceae bacterium]